MKPLLPTQYRFQKWTFTLAGIALLCLWISLWVGPIPPDSFALFLRFKRSLLAFFMGGTLAACGCALQATLKNPLAEPYMLGVSGSAALFGSFGIWLALDYVPLFAVIGAFLATLPLFLFPRPIFNPSLLILFGLCINVFTSALISILKLMLPPEKAQILLFWLSGTVPYLPTEEWMFVLCSSVIAIAFLLQHRGHLQLLSLGSDQASMLGVYPTQLNRRVLLITSLAIGILVSFCGMIGFVGLLVPHLLRLVLGSDQRLLLPSCALFGGTLLLVLDTVSRASFAFLYTEPPVGTLTAFLGAPFLIVFLARSYMIENNSKKSVVKKQEIIPIQAGSKLLKKPVFSCEKLQIAIPNQSVLHLNLNLDASECLVIIGQNGSGKTTLLKHLCGLLQATKGTVKINGCVFSNHPIGKTEKPIAYASQLEECDMDLPVETRLQSALPQRHKPISHLQRDLILQIGAELNLLQTLGKAIGQVSVGEQKRILIASSLLQPSALIYCIDEPFSSLDPYNQSLVKKAIQHRLEKGKIFIITDHDNNKTQGIASQFINLSSLTKSKFKEITLSEHFILHGGRR